MLSKFALVAFSAAPETASVWDHAAIHFVSVAILIFLSFALAVGGLLLWQNKSDATQTIKVIVVIAVVGVSAVLLVAGYSNEQLTPITGLFGAIVGYVLGKDSSSK